MLNQVSKLVLAGFVSAILSSIFAPSVAPAKILTYTVKSFFNDGGSLSVDFSFDPSTYDPTTFLQPFATNWGFVTTPGTILPGATYTPANGGVCDGCLFEEFTPYGTIYNVDFISFDPNLISAEYELYLAFSPLAFSGLLSGQDVVPLNTEAGWSVECAECNPYRSIEAGAIAVLVPEPATWVMMLLGFAGLGYTGYRQAKRVSQSAGNGAPGRASA
jgi:hypothetical protein